MFNLTKEEQQTYTIIAVVVGILFLTFWIGYGVTSGSTGDKVLGGFTAIGYLLLAIAIVVGGGGVIMLRR